MQIISNSFNHTEAEALCMQSNGKTSRKNDCTKGQHGLSEQPSFTKIPCVLRSPRSLTTRTPAFVTIHAGTPEEAILLCTILGKICSSWASLGGKNPSAPRRLCFPGGQPQALREARTRPTQSVRPGRPADALEYGAERHHRRRHSVLGGIIGATSLLATNYLVVRFLYDHRKLDQLVEGKANVLVETGKVRTQNLKKELITVSQFEAAARKQGFDSLSAIEQMTSPISKSPSPPSNRSACRTVKSRSSSKFFASLLTSTLSPS